MCLESYCEAEKIIYELHPISVDFRFLVSFYIPSFWKKYKELVRRSSWQERRVGASLSIRAQKLSDCEHDLASCSVSYCEAFI